MKNTRIAIITFFIGLLFGTAGMAIATGSKGSSLFSDVPTGAYYDDAVGEMYDAGIIRGYADGKYGPNDNVTRGQVAVMLKRFRDELLQGGIASIQPQDTEDTTTASTTTTTTSNVRNAEGSVRFTIGKFDVAENAGTATVTVVRTGGDEGVVSVDVAVEDLTATGGSDYERKTGVITFANGETSRTFTIRVFDDSLEEGDETMRIVLSNPSGGLEIGIPSSAVLTIEDDELAKSSSGSTVTSNPFGQLAFSATQFSMSEKEGVIDITVVRRFGSGGAVSVQYSTNNGSANSNSDYGAVSGALSFADREVAKVFSVPITDDANTEGLEKFNVSLSNPTGGASIGMPSTVDVKIIDNEVLSFGTGSLRLSEPSYTVLESSKEAVITVERVGGAKGTITVNYATSNGSAKKGLDYTEMEGTLTFLAGESMKTISVPITEDDANDPDESFNITISSPTNGANLITPETATVTIQ